MLDKLKKNKRLIIYMLLSIVWVCVIFSFSMQTADESSELSGGFISRVLGVFLPENFIYMEQLEFLVRKLAHFTEYMILGILVSMTLLEAKISKIITIGSLICVVVASCDETIQLFSDGRAGQITDVLLDGTGALSGTVFVMVVYEWIQKRRIGQFSERNK